MTETFGSYLRTLREEANLSMSKLASDIGISVTYLSDVERDKRAPLTSKRILLARDSLDLKSNQEMRLRLLSARIKEKVEVDISKLDDDVLERLIYLTMDYE